MISALILRLFGMRPLRGAAPPAIHKDPVARYLDGQIDVETLEAELDRRVLGMADVVGEEWR